MPSFFLFSFVSCLHFVCKVRQETSSRSFGGVQLHIYRNCIPQTRLLSFKTPEVSKMKVCTAHDAHSSEVRGPEALLRIFFVSNFSAFLSEALLGLFSIHFFRNSFSLIRVRKDRNNRNPQKCGRLEALKKKSANAEKSAKSPSLYIYTYIHI